MLVRGDARSLPLADGSIDAIVTDPPYGLEFMGKEWDKLDTRQPNDPTFHRSGVGPFDRATVRYASAPSYGGAVGAGMQDWHSRWAIEALRVAKPGAHLLAFGGTRTHHRLMCAIEDAGWEIRDVIMWVYGSGFPKSLDVSKAIDKAAGVERKAGTQYVAPDGKPRGVDIGIQGGKFAAGESAYVPTKLVTVPATEEARQWEGWGTALKPAWEPIIVARKPLAGTVAENVLRYGTGAINIDGCRVGYQDTADASANQFRPSRGDGSVVENAELPSRRGTWGEWQGGKGRWPANLIHDGSDEVLAGFPDAGSSQVRIEQNSGRADESQYRIKPTPGTIKDFGDAGSVSRYFYCAKASRAERGADNTHPTVKPLALMRYLVRLVTPPGGLVLDPFMGSGSTGVACRKEGQQFIGVELNPAYVGLAVKRLRDTQPGLGLTHEREDGLYDNRTA